MESEDAQAGEDTQVNQTGQIKKKKKKTRTIDAKHTPRLQALSCCPWPMINVPLEHVRVCS